MAITVIPVDNNRSLSEFIHFPYRLLKRWKAFVPPLISDVKTTLDKQKNPFFQHADIQMFLARENGRVVGRIAAIIDRNFIETRKEMIGLFGFFDAIDDAYVAKALFNTASKWLREENLKKMLGPANPSMNDEIGVLIDAFNLPPRVKMVWNPPYYPILYEEAGFKKSMDVLAWTMSKEDISDRLLRMGDAIVKRTKASFRTPDLKNFDKEMNMFRSIYNEAWAQNWGFVPWTKDEFDHAAKSIKQILDKDLVLIAEVDGKPVGFSLALPDINLALRHINGRLFPFGLPILLWHARKIKEVRVVILGVIKEYRNKGIDTALYYETFMRGTKKGYNIGEMSWILENNEPMIKMLQMMGAKPYKTYRLYERDL